MIMHSRKDRGASMWDHLQLEAMRLQLLYKRPDFVYSRCFHIVKGQAGTLSPCRIVHVYRVSSTNILTNKIQSVTFLVQWHFIYWHEMRSDNDATSATSSQSIIDHVSQFHQAYANRFSTQAQRGDMIQNILEGGRECMTFQAIAFWSRHSSSG